MLTPSVSLRCKTSAICQASIPVDRKASRASGRLTDTALGLTTEPFQSALVFADVRFEFLETAAVVVLRTHCFSEKPLRQVQ
jgi:hypothetical protein